jgi:hypothetical protein
VVELGNDIVNTITKINVLVCNQMCSLAIDYRGHVYLLFNSRFKEQLVYEFFIKSTSRRDENCD